MGNKQSNICFSNVVSQWKYKKHMAFMYKMCSILIVLSIVGIEYCFFTFIFKDFFRFSFLLSRYALKFIFLLLTGFFLYYLNYQILGIRVSFNAFIIYMGNNLLKEFNMKGIEIVYFFIFVYFVFIFLYQCFYLFHVHELKKKNVLVFFRQMLTSVLMWLLLTTTYNFIIEKFDVDISHLSIIDTFLFFIIIFIHHFQKTFFVFLNLKIERKYYSFYYHSAPYLLFDSIFIYFSMILGSVYQFIGILNTSFFIIFLAFSFLIMKILGENLTTTTRFYSLCSFLSPDDIIKNNMPFFQRPALSFINAQNDFLIELPKTVVVIAITPLSHSLNNKPIFFNERLTVKRRFFLYQKRFFCSILMSQKEISELCLYFQQIMKIPVRFSFSVIDSEKLKQLPIDYIFGILIHKLKLKRRKSENQIVVSNGYIVL